MSNIDLDALEALLHSMGSGIITYEARQELQERMRLAIAELREARGKAIAYDLDKAGIESRERDAVELVDARARIAELTTRLDTSRKICDEARFARGHLGKRIENQRQRIVELEAKLREVPREA